MEIRVYSILWVKQDLYHQVYVRLLGYDEPLAEVSGVYRP